MVDVGLVLPDELHGVSIEQTIEFATRAESAGFSSVWKGETTGSNGLMTLSAVARATDDVRLGTGIANVFSRSPALLAMSAGTLEELADGRAVLGLGVSSPPIVENWHGGSFDRPLRRLRETIELVRLAFEEERLTFDGGEFDVGPYTTVLLGDRDCPPLFTGAMGAHSRRLTGEFADGWLPSMVARSAFPDQVAEVRSAARSAGRNPDDVEVVPWVPTAVSAAPAVAANQAREFLAQEMAMGYAKKFRAAGFEHETDEALQHWRAEDRDLAAAAITDDLLETFCAYGTPDDCRATLKSYAAAGADEVVVLPTFGSTTDEIEALIDAVAPNA